MKLLLRRIKNPQLNPYSMRCLPTRKKYFTQISDTQPTNTKESVHNTLWNFDSGIWAYGIVKKRENVCSFIRWCVPNTEHIASNWIQFTEGNTTYNNITVTQTTGQRELWLMQNTTTTIWVLQHHSMYIKLNEKDTILIESFSDWEMSHWGYKSTWKLP